MAVAKTKGLHFFDPRRNLMDRAGCLAEVPPGRRGTIHQVVEAPAQQAMKVDAPAISTDQRAAGGLDTSWTLPRVHRR
jgi:hypothetical protein